MKKINFLLIALSIAVIMQAQDHSFLQFNAVPLYYNPGYAGSVESPRLALSYNQSMPYTSRSFSYLSYDQALKRLHSGVGLVMYNNYPGINTNTYNTFYCGLAYAAKFNIGNKLAISPALKVGYRKDSGPINQYDALGAYSGLKNVLTQNMDVSLGIVFNTEKLHFGFAVDHINEPRIINFSYSLAALPKKYSAQLGYTFQKQKNSDFSVNTALLFQRQANESKLTLNASARYKFAIIGGGISMPDAGKVSYNFLLGFYSKRCMIGYSIEPHINHPFYKNYISHELSLRYVFSTQKENKGPDGKPVKRHRIFKNRKRILQN